MNETGFKKKVEQFLEDEGFWYIKYWGGGGFTKSGIPDILACIHGHFLRNRTESSSEQADKTSVASHKQD